MKVNDVVYNKRYNTIGVVLDSFSDEDIRTDADGVVYSSDLLLIKSKDHLNQIINATGASIAPSTMEQINYLDLL